MTAITVPHPGTPALAPRGFAWRVFADEAGKGLRLMWRRRAVTIAGVVTLGLTYLSIQFFIGGGHIVVPVLALTLPALFGASIAYITSVSGAGGIAEEVNGGTLEQAHLSPASPSVLLAGRAAALAVEGLITAAALALVFGLGFRPHWVTGPGVLVPLALTILDALGYALLMTALVLRVAAIGAVVHVFNMAIMFFGGLYVPITLFPHGVEVFARFLPTALGTEVLNTTLSGRGLGAAWADGTLPWLLIHVVVMGGLGWATHLYTVRRARREGGLSPR